MKPQDIAGQSLNLHLVIAEMLRKELAGFGEDGLSEIDEMVKWGRVKRLRRLVVKTSARHVRIVNKHYRTVESSIAEWSK